jgi:hypothetical protein
MNKVILFLLLFSVLTGCVSNRYAVEQAEYSAWKDGEMQYRKKTILLDTKTGETWGLAWDKNNKNNKKYTRDGYGWEKMPKKNRINVE